MLSRLKISLVLTPLALTILIGVYIYSLWAQESERRAELPTEATSALSRDLLKFHQKRGSFPENLQDLEGIIWEKKERNYTSDGRSLIHRNYFYIYTRTEPHGYTLWGLPVGRIRDEASTFFVLGTPQKVRKWKGPAVPLSEAKNLTPIPTATQLGILGLAEQWNISERTGK